MKLELGDLVKILLLQTLLFACAPKTQDGPYRVQIPWPQTDGSYAVQKVEVATLTNPSTMHGGAASLRLQRGPYGPPPKADFITDSDGTLIPANFETLQMAVVYAHMEKLEILEDSMGFKGLLPRPRTVSVEFAMQDDVGRPMSDNAFYYPSWDSLVILPFKGRDIPITFNAGVLAHEHFHAIFQHTVGSASVSELSHSEVPWAEMPSLDCEKRMRNVAAAHSKAKAPDQKILPMILMRALNEGLADYWGWVYTRDDSYIAKSLPQLTDERKISSQIKALPSKEFFEDIAKIQQLNVAVDVSYCLGTYFSRFMRRLSEVEGTEVTAQNLLSRLIRARRKGRLEIGPKMLLSILFPQEEQITTTRCELVKAFAPGEAESFNKACAESLK